MPNVLINIVGQGNTGSGMKIRPSAVINKGNLGFGLRKMPCLALSHVIKSDLPIIDIWKDPGVWGVLDGGCNTTCASTKWMRNIAKKLANYNLQPVWVRKFGDRPF